jgi:hypothetical protein
VGSTQAGDRARQRSRTPRPLLRITARSLVGDLVLISRRRGRHRGAAIRVAVRWQC